MYDLLDLLEDITRPAYDRPAPLGFTSAYFTPDELLKARKELARLRGDWSKDHPTFGAWMLGQIAAVLALLLIPISVMDGRVNHWMRGKSRPDENGLSPLVIRWSLLLVQIQVCYVYLNACLTKLPRSRRRHARRR